MKDSNLYPLLKINALQTRNHRDRARKPKTITLSNSKINQITASRTLVQAAPI